jgi:isopentenyl-diphosphate delta-isomerase
VLVDERGDAIGTSPKLAAHLPPGLAHRAFSVFVLDDHGRLLLQRRAPTKHHFRDRWSNTCCSHPEPGEAVLDAAHRRLDQEMGLAADLREVGRIRYRAVDDDSGLVEDELDHVVVGRLAPAGQVPRPDPAEVSSWRWLDPAELRAALVERPGDFTPWLGLALDVAVPAAAAAGPGCSAG